nr:MBG domain-containing protein [Sinomicrobium weinanense]
MDGNTGNWTLQEPEGGTYDGETAGTYVFTVPLVLPEPGDDPYFLNPDELRAEITVTVAKGVPELSASWNGTDIDPAAGLSLGYGDGGTLVFASSDPNAEITYGFGENDNPVLNLDDLETVIAQQAGTATLTVQQAETDNFEAATLGFTVSVAPGAITVVPEPGQAKVYGEDDPGEYGYALAEGSELEEGDALTEIISGSSRGEGEDAGAYDIILTFEGEKAANYDITFEEDNNAFAVTPYAITVTAEDKSRVYGADDPELTYMITPPLLGDDAFTGTLERETGETVGTYTITQGTLTAGNNYAITFEEGTLTITAADYEDITFNAGEFTYDGTEHTLVITGELPEGTSVTYQNNGRTDAGTQTVTAEIDGGENYEDMELTADLTITPRSITVTADNQQKTYGTDDPELTYTADMLIGGDSFTGMLERDAGEAVGEYMIIQGTLTAGNNYAITFEEGTFAITPADYGNITFNNVEFTYDGTEHSLAITGELPEGTSVAYQNNGRTDAGTQTVTARIDGGENYEDMELTAELTIIPMSVTVTADNQEKAYGMADPELTYTVSPALIGDDMFTGIPERESGEAVGEYAITQGTLTAGDNYTITYEGAILTIVPADYENITFNNADYTYDGTEHTLSITGELPEGTSVAYQNNGRTDAGTQTVTARIDGGENYEDMELTAELTVTPLSVTVTADNQEKAYGIADPELTYTVSPTLIGDDMFTGMPERESGEAVGEYVITQGTLSAGNNYAMTFENGILTITTAGYDNIAFNDGEFTYDGTEYTLTITGELPEGVTVTYENNGRTDAGTQEVTANIDGGINYEDMELTAILTVHKAAQEIVFDAIPARNLGSTSGFLLEAYATSGLPIVYTYTYDGTEPPATVTPDGEVTLLSSGEITITASQEGNHNFLPATPVNRTLRISSDDASIRVLRIAEKTFENPGPETGYVVDCDNMAGSVMVEIETEANAMVSPAHRFTMELSRPGIYTEEITVTSEDGSATKTYKVVVERRFDFEDIVIRKFDNVLLVNNNPQTNGGYNFMAYKWYKNGTFIGGGQYYSAGDNSTDLLDPDATYEVEMTTTDGEILRTCPMKIELQHSGEIIVYPNPVLTGNTINIQASIPREELETMQVRVYNHSGQQVRQFFTDREDSTMKVSGMPPGVYILQCITDRLQKSFKIIVK